MKISKLFAHGGAAALAANIASAAIITDSHVWIAGESIYDTTLVKYENGTNTVLIPNPEHQAYFAMITSRL